jgi:hypothetical protein
VDLSLKVSFLAIALFVLSLKCTPVFALEAYRTDNVFVSEEGARYASDSFIKREICTDRKMLVSKESQNIRTGDFIIEQEKLKIGEVLVSRPIQIDIIISDILKANGIRSIDDYAKWLQENIRYERDKGGDIWALPEETLERKYGDCEDYAFLNAAVLHVLGYHPKVLSVWCARILMGRLIPNHAICVFEKDGRYLYFDNEKLKVTDASSMEEFAKYISASYYCSSVSEITFINKKRETLFTKSSYVDNALASE